MEQIKRFMKEEEGLELTEYAVMAALLVAGLYLVIENLGTEINDVFQSIITALQ